MRKTIIVLVIILLVGLGAIGYFGWEAFRGSPNNGNGTTTPTSTNGNNNGGQINFMGEGNLVRNNPGLKPNIWYLVYEQTDAPALTVELSFNNSSVCLFSVTSVDCSKLSMPNGSRAQVQGAQVGNVVTVSMLTVLAEDFIKVNSVKPNDVFANSMRVTGEARGFWYFEASFPLKIINQSNGQVITSTFAQAKGEWMTTNFVPFDVTLRFNVPTTTLATLILEADNPSGLPENHKEIRIPVVLVPANQIQKVSLFYYNPEKDKDQSGNIMCSKAGLEKVERNIQKSSTPLNLTIRKLIEGNLTDEERSRGITTEFPLEGLEFDGAVINDGVATLNFFDPKNRTGGGSCRVSILWAQIEATAKQFPSVKEVKFNPEELFQP